MKGYFREGATYSVDCEMIEILDLKINPTKNKLKTKCDVLAQSKTDSLSLSTDLLVIY
ncbi:hypothetical protein SAMN05421540_10647 [Psychroflexus halocasei]|uniref:Uncharacterized protein n=2 Tax=Flavobacteriaceae TaxID=49546 RepID=A0A1H4BHK0_9FLAO|nr:hypothetical protein SAMN05421540_10647 [Psychroflexus halocasei]